jgi:hypothetical protein
VDTIAIRKDTRKSKGDRFEVILVQLKGGSAKMPNADERERLRDTGKRYNAKVVLFEWRPKKGWCKFSVLKGDDWMGSTAENIFG